jgi:hypothetical protein
MPSEAGDFAGALLNVLFQVRHLDSMNRDRQESTIRRVDPGSIASGWFRPRGRHLPTQ